jgi:hypothetical protein
MIRKCLLAFGLLASTSVLTSAIAQEMISSGFMTDYSQLRKVGDGSADYRYVAPGAVDRLADYAAVMIDEPEIFIAPNSEYKGVKPKQLVALSESLRAGIASALTEDLFVVDRVGHNVLYISVAISNLKLKKKKKKPRNYVPIAFIAGSIQGAATTDISKKADLDSLVFEFEAFDSLTGERLVAVIDSLRGVSDDPVTWEDLDRYMVMYGQQVRCRFLNARLPVEKRQNCLSGS